MLFDVNQDCMENLPDPDVIAAEIRENLESALALFAGIEEGLGE